MPELDAHLAEVLKVITRSPSTLEEIAARYEKPPIMKVEVSWISKTMLPNSLSHKTPPPRELKDSLGELVALGLVKKSVTRYLDGPLDEDTQVFYLPEPKK